jgi:hypothetical protein
MRPRIPNFEKRGVVRGSGVCILKSRSDCNRCTYECSWWYKLRSVLIGQPHQSLSTVHSSGIRYLSEPRCTAQLDESNNSAISIPSSLAILQGTMAKLLNMQTKHTIVDSYPGFFQQLYCQISPRIDQLKNSMILYCLGIGSPHCNQIHSLIQIIQHTCFNYQPSPTTMPDKPNKLELQLELAIQA